MSTMIEPARRSLLIRGKATSSGDVVTVSPHGKHWKYITFRALRMPAGSSLQTQTYDDETVLVVISGTINVSSSAGAWQQIGKRADPFSGPAESLYLPAATEYAVHAASACELCVCAAPAREHFPARLIAPTDDGTYTRGAGQAKRRITNILMQPDEAGALFLTEVVTFPGNWSSYPPHKHDRDDPPIESQLEELYYYRMRPGAGFAFQRVYTSDGELDETMTVGDADVVLVPRGYHVCAAAAEYWVYYLNVLAGPKHVYHMTFDPAHAWIKENWKW